MKIAVWHNLPSGGGKRALYHHVKGLVERGHTVESWTLTTADPSYLPLGELVQEHVIPLDRVFRASRGRIGSVLGQYREAAEHIRAMDAACQQCAREITAGGFDVVFVNSCRFYCMPFVVRHIDGPTVLYLGEPYRPLYEANPALPWIGRVGEVPAPIHRRMAGAAADLVRLQILRDQAREEWVNAQSCDAILVNSYYSRETVLRTYGRDARVCYLGIDTSLFHDTHQPRESFIVGLGSFTPAKGIDLAVESVALLPEPRPALVWISNSEDLAYRKEMTALAEERGVDLWVRTGVSDSELVDTLNRATLMLYTSRLEPFGLAPLEANACATPVVAVAEGGVRESIRDGVNGLLVDREPERIAEAMGTLLRDPALARRLGEEASNHVRKDWSFQRSIDRLEQHLFAAARLEPTGSVGAGYAGDEHAPGYA